MNISQFRVFVFFLNYSSIFIHVGWFQLGRSRFSLAFGKWGMSLLHKNTLWARIPRWALGSAPHLGYFIEIPRRQQWGRPLPPHNTQCIETTGRTNPTHPPIPNLPFLRPGSCHSGRSQPRLCRGQGPFTAIGRLLPKRERCRITLAYSEPSSSCFFHSVDASGSPVGCPVV